MHIQFDPRDRNACGAVIAAIMALHGELPTDGLSFADDTDDAIVGINAETGDVVPASEAFDAPRPDEAFGDAPNAAAPVVVPAVPAAPAAAVAAPPAGVELDAAGLPWDGRIHAGKASAKIKTKEGTWRKRRNVDDTLVAQVTAELRQVMAAGGTPTVPTLPAAAVAASPEPAPAPAPTAVPVAPPPTPVAADTASGPAAATPAGDVPLAPAADAATPAVPSAAPSPAVPASAGPVATFADLMRKITGLQTAGKLTIADTNEIAVSLGLTSVRDLIQRPDMVASFDALLPADA